MIDFLNAKPPQRTVIIAMIAIDQIVDVVSVRNGLVATVGTVLMG